MSLTKKQALFVEAYLIEPNGKKAALKAGYSAAGVEVTASKLLRHPAVAAALKNRRQILQVRTSVTPEMVVAELAKLGFADIRQVVEWSMRKGEPLFTSAGEAVESGSVSVSIKDSSEISPEAAAAIAEVSQSKDGTIKIKMHDKLGALVRLGQHLGMFRAPAAPEEPGKKQQRDTAAETADRGTGWAGLLQ